MSTEPRKQRAGSGKQNANLREDVQEAIDRVWPDGVVELLSFDSDESYFWDVHPKLSRALLRIRHTSPLHEREADGGPIWWESDPEEDPPDDFEQARSYHVFFVSPQGEAFTSETETEGITEPEFITEEFAEAGWGEDPPIVRIPGTSRTGWVVAVSLLAPFAVIELGEMTNFEDGSTTQAEIEPYVQNEDGERINLEEHFQKARGAKAYKILVSLRAKIADICEKCGITVLPPEEWRKPAPWLRGGEDSLLGIEGKPIRVLDAFFFEEM